MVSFELIDNAFDKKNTLDYNLYVHISSDTLCYLIIDQKKNIVFIRKNNLPDLNENNEKSAQIESVILKDILLQKAYHSVSISVFNFVATLIPTRLFDPQNKKTYLENISPLVADDFAFSDSIQSIKAENVFTLSQKVVNVLQTYFSGAKITHSSTFLIRYFQSLAKINKGQQVFLHVGQQYLQVFYYEDGELIFYNAFPFTSSKDFIYYTMLIYEQFNLNPEETPITLTGEIMEDSEIYHLVFRYIRNLKILPNPKFLNFGTQWENRPSHWFFDLYSMAF